MRFAKFHGLGNDFVIMDFSSDGNTLPDNLPEIAAKLCNRHTGIGADGLGSFRRGYRPVRYT